ncbi:SirB2 family protein [Aestuariibacter halophilus]|uniref:SirB2 family protein n=1 Tax=Fluctibacter halophilus TaxID=226011 RepID=A0ABS8G7B9_9ALTE|nr:SirB2 family protein [Aestuariibacter halophilus]MCC2616016.1 SirB2 family protein [Aestuariibacter halophilus]
MYMMVKHLHLTLVATSALFFIFRFFLTLQNNGLLQKKWMRVLPHVIDTLLLISAVVLCVLIAQYPLVNGWLTEKVVGLVCYILMGMWALKWARSTPMRWIGFVGALTWLVIIAKVAVTKQPILFG